MATFREEIYRFEGDGKREAFNVRVGVVLNRAARADADGKFLVAVKVTQGNDKRYFCNVEGLRMSVEDFGAMCREYETAKGRLRRYADVGKKVNETFNRVASMVDGMVFDGNFIFDDFKERWKKAGNPPAVELTPYTLWQSVAESKSAGTEESYLNSLARFKADMGCKVRFRDFSKSFIARWRDRMIRDELSRTTIGIYCRSLRVVLNEAVKLGQIADVKTMFDGLTIGGVNSYNSRKEHYLTVEQWRKLWHFYETKGEGNEKFQLWRSDYQRERLDALGMMLFMYLADGMNLRDVLCLRYDDFYYQHDKKQMHFQRQKVADRTGLKVVFPVLPQIRLILERQGLKEERGGLVFGNLRGRVRFDGSKDDTKEIRRLTALENSNIADRMKKVAEAVDMKVKPTPTWCRHSYASNLTQAGVPKDYISASMGHSDRDTTSGYIDRYSYEQMVEHNRRLLADPSEKNKEWLKELLSDMSKEEILELLKDRD